MKTEITEIRESLKAIFEGFLGPLKVTVDKPTNFWVTGTIDAPEGKKIVNGIYFGNLVPKPKDVRFYLYAAYTHPEEFE